MSTKPRSLLYTQLYYSVSDSGLKECPYSWIRMVCRLNANHCNFHACKFKSRSYVCLCADTSRESRGLCAVTVPLNHTWERRLPRCERPSIRLSFFRLLGTAPKLSRPELTDHRPLYACFVWYEDGSSLLFRRLRSSS